MTDDRSLERTARSWIEAGPTRAPEHAVEAALMTIESTPQERDLRILRRLPIMNTVPRLTAAAAIVVLAVGGAAFLLRPAASNVGTTPSDTPPASPTSSAAPSLAAAKADLIPEGLYATAPVQVADIITSINADRGLTPAQRTDLIKNVIAIEGAKTFSASIELRGGRWTQRETVDGNVLVGSGGTYAFLGTDSIALREPCCVSGFQVGQVPNGFTLKSLSATTNEEEAFVARFLFESQPFIRVP